MALTFSQTSEHYVVQADQWLPRPVEEVWAFIADVENNQLFMEGWINLCSIRLDPPEMQLGTRIEYRLKVRGVPLKFIDEVVRWEPLRCMATEQASGPFKWIRSEITFEPQDGGTMMRYQVLYQTLGGAFTAWWMRRNFKLYFEYRERRLQEWLGEQAD